MIYKRCNPSFIIDSCKLHIVKEMYPYDSDMYENIATETHLFLQKECVGYPGNTQVLPMTQHDGHGRLWGIILLQYPFWKKEWQVFAQYGHYSRGTVLAWIKKLDAMYYNFLEQGQLPMPVYPYGAQYKPDSTSLKEYMS